MTTCIACTHWQPQKGDPKMAAMGFSVCAKNPLLGHTTSADAKACEKFAALDTAKVAARRLWLEKRESRNG